jgi:hypothetical protein
MFLPFSVASRPLSNDPCVKEVKHFGSHMRSADVSEKICHSSGIKAAIAFCLCMMVDVKNVSSEAVAPFLWALVDADEHWTGIPERLAGANTKAGSMEAPHKEYG